MPPCAWPAAGGRRPIPDDVARHAYELYEQRGAEHGHDWDEPLTPPTTDTRRSTRRSASARREIYLATVRSSSARLEALIHFGAGMA